MLARLSLATVLFGLGSVVAQTPTTLVTTSFTPIRPADVTTATSSTTHVPAFPPIVSGSDTTDCKVRFNDFNAAECILTPSNETYVWDDPTNGVIVRCHSLGEVCTCNAGWSPDHGVCVTCPGGYVAGDKWSMYYADEGTMEWECLPGGAFVVDVTCPFGGSDWFKDGALCFNSSF